MTVKRIVSSTAAVAMLFAAQALHADEDGKKVRMYNTAKQKLMEGKSVVGGTITTDDPNVYCAMANSGSLTGLPAGCALAHRAGGSARRPDIKPAAAIAERPKPGGRTGWALVCRVKNII